MNLLYFQQAYSYSRKITRLHTVTMKRTTFLTCILACLTSLAPAATYTNLTEAWCDETNKVIYDGQGYFAVESAVSTSLELTINLSALESYVNSNDYRSGQYVFLWDADAADYGLADNADTAVDNGSREPYLTGYWNGGAWSTTNKIDYSTLNQHATDGSVTLCITNSNSSGVTVSVKDTAGAATTLYTATNLLTTHNTQVTGYHVNLNYVTAVTLNTPSTLDTASYVPPVDYSKPFVSERTNGSSVGRITFLGDSITHGVNDASYRWQFFKTLVDNGIENEIAGPREGYYSTPGHTADAGESYGGADFANVHLAQASGRTHNIISGSTTAEVNGTTYTSGVNYGGHSTASTAARFDSNTWFSLMGTNDLLSDTPNSGPSTDQYATQMQKMLGGTVSYDATADSYTWTAGENWGSMAQMVEDVCGEGDTFYALSITPWGNHSNHNRDMDHYAGQEFNRNLAAWVSEYAATSGKKVVYVDVTRGMVDVSSPNRFMGHDAFFNSSSDRLHPNDQGSLLMAGNLARAMGIGGRTAGLARSGTTTWNSSSPGTIAAGRTASYAGDAFTQDKGYTIDFSAVFGNGATGGWLGTDSALSISLGDGVNSGTLSLSEACIMWGNEVLFCHDTSALAAEGNLRIAWHNGNAADNVLSGYYVWLGDMLIGHGLAASEGAGLNGISISAAGAAGTVSKLSWTDTSYAPTTSGAYAVEYAYLLNSDSQVMPLSERAAEAIPSGISYDDAPDITATAGQTLVTSAPESDLQSFEITSGAGWTGITNCNYAGSINVLVTGTTAHTIFGVMGAAKAGRLTLEVAENAVVGNGTYSGQTAAIAGSYNGGSAAAFNVYVDGGEVQGDIVGGAVHGSGTVEAVTLVVNSGTVQGHLLGGSKTSGTVHEAGIIVNGGTISGDIVAGGHAGTVGNTSVVVNGGVISGSITKGAATRSEGARASVTVVGNKAFIGGNIEADDVTLRNLSRSGYADGFDNYAGTIEAGKLTLDNVQVGLQASLAVSAIELINGSNTSAALGASCVLDTLHLGSGTTFGAYKDAATPMATSEHESSLTLTTLQAGTGATLNANIAFTADSALILEGTLTMGSDVALTTGMSLTLSESMLAELYGHKAVTLFSGVDNLTLDHVAIADGETLNANGVFSNLNVGYDYSLAFVGGAVNLAAVPEPASASLTLAALVLLCARRRRKA